MVFVKHNTLMSDLFFSPIFIPGFSGFRYFRVWLQGPAPGFRSSRQKDKEIKNYQKVLQISQPLIQNICVAKDITTRLLGQRLYSFGTNKLKKKLINIKVALTQILISSKFSYAIKKNKYKKYTENTFSMPKALTQRK